MPEGNENSLHALTGSLEPVGRFRKLVGAESLGRLPVYRMEVLSEQADIDPFSKIGTRGGVTLKDLNSNQQHYHGVITQFLNAGPRGGYQVYEVELRPWLWLLTRTLNTRIYQNKTVLEILEQVFKTKNGFTDYTIKAQGSYVAREYCVQYRESDFDFVTRLMEEEGIYYFFEHTATSHKLILCDASASHTEIAGTSIPFAPKNSLVQGTEHIYEWRKLADIQPGNLVLTDYDYNKPAVDLQVRLNSNRGHSEAALEHYDYPGRYLNTSDGQTIVRNLAAGFSILAFRREATALSQKIRLGTKFTLSDHPTSGENVPYIPILTETTIVSGEVELQSSQSGNSIEVKFQCVPADQNFRLPIRTPKPTIAGVQSAVVVGKEGEDIWTDSLGRVKVQFPWDRDGQKNENSSCWIRVSQTWAGKGWGALHIPRIGQEVLVDFIDGNPDRPIVTGCVYNPNQTPPFSLPNEAAFSGVRSRSTKQGSTETFNEIRLEDTKDAERIYVRAEKDFVREVENNDTLKVGLDKKDKGDQTITIFNNQTVTIGCSEAEKGEQTITIYGNQTETITTGNRVIEISAGNDTLNVKQGSCTIEAAQSILLKVGGSKIEITTSEITLQASTINIKGDMSASIQCASGEFKASSDLTLQGGIVKIN